MSDAAANQPKSHTSDPAGKPLHVCLCAKYTPGIQGGIEQYVLALARGLRELISDGGVHAHGLKLTMLVGQGCAEAIDKAVNHDSGRGDRNKPAIRIAVVEDISQNASFMNSLRSRLARSKRSRADAALRAPLGDAGRDWPHTPAASRGVLESLGCDIVHFAVQRAFLTDVPSIYQPHDLQHLHLPQMLELGERLSRESSFPVYCRRARAVAVASSWVKRDLIEHYGLAHEKVHVTAYAPPNAFSAPPDAAGLKELSAKLALPDRFAFYPAQTYKHKNHVSLLKAIAMLRDRGGPRVNVVFSGRRSEHAAAIDELIVELGLKAQVQFLGFVSEAELAGIYTLAVCTVIPSRFEAASFPMWESFHAGTAVACSDITSLPEQAGNAALIFGATDIAAMASCIEQLWTDVALRERLVAAGRQRLAALSWQRTARQFVALYHAVAGRPLTDWQSQILQEPALL